jgi:uroporphyrinogen-III synthase
LTREKGKNDKLLKELLLTDDLSARIQTVCLPCIGHTTGPDEDALQPALEEFDWDWIAVTSPEAARVLAVAWDPVFSTESKSKERQRPSVCAVGTATCETLAELGIDVAFVPSKATAKTLVKELPSGSGQPGQTQTVLYPASAQAAKTLQEGLTARGFVVTRLDTYDTLPTTWTGAEQSMASNVHVACFASPSAVTGWLENQKTGNNKSVLAACIGETSAAACRLQGFPQENVFFPDKPGLAGWVAAVRAAVDSLEVAEQLAEQSAHP